MSHQCLVVAILSLESFLNQLPLSIVWIDHMMEVHQWLMNWTVVGCHSGYACLPRARNWESRLGKNGKEIFDTQNSSWMTGLGTCWSQKSWSRCVNQGMNTDIKYSLIFRDFFILSRKSWFVWRIFRNVQCRASFEHPFNTSFWPV